MVQGDGKLHKEDVQGWCREMVNYIKKMSRDVSMYEDGI